MAKGVAAIFAGWVAAKFFLRFGNWNAVFYCAAGMAFVSAMLILILRAMPLPTLSTQPDPVLATAKAS